MFVRDTLRLDMLLASQQVVKYLLPRRTTK